VRKSIEDAFSTVSGLSRLPDDRVSTLLVGGKPLTGPPDDFSRRRTGAEILQSGITSGPGDNAIALLHLLDKQGFETRFIDAVRISTKSLEDAAEGCAFVAVLDPQNNQWVLADPARSVYIWPFDLSSKTVYQNCWIGFRGPIADYPVHDPASLTKFYRDTLKTVPMDYLNHHLFRFQFTVDSSLIGPDGKYRNPHLEQFLGDNGNFLNSRGIRPVNEIPVRLVAGGPNGVFSVDESDRGWVYTVGQESTWGWWIVDVLEDRLNRNLEENRSIHAIVPKAPSAAFWTGAGILCALLLGVLVWQRRRLAVQPSTLAYWGCQLLGWGGLLMLTILAVLNQPGSDTGGIVYGSVYCLLGVALTGLLRREIRRRRWLSGPTWPMVAAVPVFGTVHAGAAETYSVVVHAMGKGLGQNPGDALKTWAVTLAFWTVWTVLYVLLTGPRRHREAEVRLQLALREAELRALEAQINPHFLFNCLNSIRALVAENPAQSQDMLTRLANILRYNLRRDVEHTVPLHSEVEIVSDYLALESARFEDRLRVHISIDPDAAPVPVPPMLLQTLVENALKHGIAPRAEGGDLSVRAAIVGDSMMMEVENPGEIAETDPTTTPLGLANIRERLRILYNGRASFELKNRDGHVAATVLIPMTA
jgi:hypothetical protein